MIGIFIGVFMIGMLAGAWLILSMHRSAMRHSPNELIQAIRDYHEAYTGDEDIDDPNSLIVSFEYRNSYCYLYDVTTKAFAGQGKTLDEAIEVVQARFPNRDIVVQQVTGN